jgi:hypothetical protein
MSAVASRLHVSPDSEDFSQLVAQVAIAESLSPLALRLEALLHLPRVADAHGAVEWDRANAELQALAADLRNRTLPVQNLATPPRVQIESPRRMTVEESDVVARTILTRFHYLGSFRYRSRHLVAWAPDGRPAALASVSPFDVPTIRNVLPAALTDGEIRVLSRVFAFDWAPRNTLTWMFGRVARVLASPEGGTVKLLLTYVNPNMGFSGASYRAGNWTLIARETGTRYAYLDGRYITDRELIRRHGTSDPEVLLPRLGPRLEYSTKHQRPLEIYALPLTSGLDDALSNERPGDHPRPTP